MNKAIPASDSTGLPIAAVERETGLGKDTLRVWEKRYGFPRPLRDVANDRLYPAAQVEQLQLIRRLLDAGQRPGKVVGLNTAALQDLLAQGAAAAQGESGQQPLTTSHRAAAPAEPGQAPAVLELLDTIAGHDLQALRHALTQAQWRMGLAPFVTELVAPLTIAVGESWAQGRFKIFEEHLYTEVITGVLRQAIGALPPPLPPQRPRVLLTTLPQEPHGLGLLMVETLLALEGCACIPLGTQTPFTDIVQAAQAHTADVVALSCTRLFGGTHLLAHLRELRAHLPAARALWVGGSSSVLYEQPLEGIIALRDLSGLPALVAQWRQGHGAD